MHSTNGITNTFYRSKKRRIILIHFSRIDDRKMRRKNVVFLFCVFLSVENRHSSIIRIVRWMEKRSQMNETSGKKEKKSIWFIEANEFFFPLLSLLVGPFSYEKCNVKMERKFEIEKLSIEYICVAPLSPQSVHASKITWIKFYE